MHHTGRFQSGQMGRAVNPLRKRFGGSNPSLPTFPGFFTSRDGRRCEAPRVKAYSGVRRIPRNEADEARSARPKGKNAGLGISLMKEPGVLMKKPGDAGIAQLVERQPSKLNVAGSSPVSRSFEVAGPK
jgi:hypothetical protein